MRTLTVKQPWADLIAGGIKTIEVRSWTTRYRGPVLITASASHSRTDDARIHQRVSDERLGITVCVVNLVDVRPATADDFDACGGFDPSGSLAWVLASPKLVSPLRVRGALGLRHVESSLLTAIGV